MKKRIAAFVLSAVLCLSLFAFAACETTPVDPPVDKDPDSITVNINKNVHGELEIMVPGGNKNETSMIECLIESVDEDVITFKTLFPNVDVNISYISVDNYANEIAQNQLAGTLGDIVWNNSPAFYDMIDSGTYLNLKPFFAASEKAETLPAYLNGDGQPQAFDYSEDFYTEFFDMATASEKCYVAPRSCDTVVTFINTEILNAAQVDMSKVVNGWSWTDFMEVCAKVRDYMDKNSRQNDYVIDANLTSWLSVCYPMLVSYGGDVLNQSGEIIIDSEATRTCLNMIKEMVDKRYINDSTVATTGSFDDGHSAMLFQSASVSLYADRLALKNKMDLVSFPLIKDNDSPKIGAGVAGYSINAKSEQQDLAWAFLSFMLSEYGQQRMALNGLNLASIRKDLSDPAIANWGQKYSSLNLAAYTFGSEYKLATNFFERTIYSAKAGMERAVKQLFTDASNSQKNTDLNAIINTAVRDIRDAMIEY